MLDANPIDYVGRRHGHWESELRAALLAALESERVDFLARVLVLQEERGFNTGRWFKLAEAVLQDPESYEMLLRFGLDSADASTIRPWLEVAAKHLGCRRLIRWLRVERDRRPQKVLLTHYWLRSLAQSAREREFIEEYLSERK